MPRFEVPLDGGETAEIEELTAEQFEQVCKRVATSNSNDGAWEVTQQGCRMSLKRVGTRVCTPAELLGPGLARACGSPRRMLLIRAAWERVHLPNEEESAGVRNLVAVEG